MIQISEPESSKSTNGFKNHPFWQLPFRSFFIFASLASVFSILAWFASLNGYLTLNSQGLLPITWHAHEMIFGFGITIAAGFILTAVQTWTGLPSIKGSPVIALLSLWLLIRLSLWVNNEYSLIAATVMQLIWWVIVISIFAKLVINSNNKRNYIFIPLFTVLACVQLTILLASYFQQHNLAIHLTRSSVLLFTVVITLIGGRVIPFFTVRGAKTEAIAPSEKVESLILPASIITALLYIVSYFFSSWAGNEPLQYLTGAVFITTGVIHFIRQARWRGLETFKVPLLWTLHLSYFAMGLGLVLVGFSYLLPELPFTTGLHVITVGTIGLMILSMISRVSLGHTGRALEVKPIITFAFILMAVAAFVRVILPLVGLPLYGWNISAIAWAIAFTCFVIVYWPILSTPRK